MSTPFFGSIFMPLTPWGQEPPANTHPDNMHMTFDSENAQLYVWHHNEKRWIKTTNLIGVDA